MAKFRRPDASNEMRCGVCGMRFIREARVPTHNVWGSRGKSTSTRCIGSGQPPRRVKGQNNSVIIRIVRTETKPPGGWVRADEVRKLLG